MRNSRWRKKGTDLPWAKDMETSDEYCAARPVRLFQTFTGSALLNCLRLFLFHRVTTWCSYCFTPSVLVANQQTTVSFNQLFVRLQIQGFQSHSAGKDLPSSAGHGKA
ncbi:MAG: hypothetical protein ACOCYO_08975 [Bacteroidota bacterium]